MKIADAVVRRAAYTNYARVPEGRDKVAHMVDFDEPARFPGKLAARHHSPQSPAYAWPGARRSWTRWPSCSTCPRGGRRRDSAARCCRRLALVTGKPSRVRVIVRPLQIWRSPSRTCASGGSSPRPRIARDAIPVSSLMRLSTTYAGAWRRWEESDVGIRRLTLTVHSVEQTGDGYTALSAGAAWTAGRRWWLGLKVSLKAGLQPVIQGQGRGPPGGFAEAGHRLFLHRAGRERRVPGALESLYRRRRAGEVRIGVGAVSIALQGNPANPPGEP